MGDLSIPRNTDYYRVEVRREGCANSMYYNRLEYEDVQRVAREADAKGETIVKVQHVMVTVSVHDVTWLARENHLTRQ